MVSGLSTRRFCAFFATQFCNAFNDNVMKNAIVILFTYKIGAISQQNEASLVTAAAGIFILPFLLFSTLGGQLADRFNKIKLIRIIKSSEIFIVLLGSIAFYFQNILLLMLTLFLMGTHSSFFGPIKFSIIPEMLSTNELNKGNALIEASTFLAILFGTILGGVLIVANHGIYFVSTLMLAVALIGWGLSLLMPIDSIKNTNVKIKKNIIFETVALLKIAKSFPGIMKAIISISWFWLIGAIFISLFPVYTKEILHAHPYIVTLFFVNFSIGVALGALIASKIQLEHTYRICALMLVLMTLGIFHLITHSHPLTNVQYQFVDINHFIHMKQGFYLIADLFIIAICGGIYVVPLYTILQTRSPSDHCARIIACNNIMNSIFLVGSAIFTIILFKLNATVLHVFALVALANLGIASYLKFTN